MNKLYIAVLSIIICVSSIHTMDLIHSDPLEPKWKIPNTLPQEVVEKIISLQLLDIHNQVNTLEEARGYLVSVSKINKQCNAYTNDPDIIKHIISNLSATCLNQYSLVCYEETIAAKFSTFATKQYIFLCNQLFSEHLNKEQVAQLLKQGADPNYRRNIRKKNFYDPEKYDLSRHCYSGCPLTFYASDATKNGLEIAQYLLELGASVDIDANGHTPLSVAVNNDLPEMVALFLQYKPTLYACSEQNYLEDAIEKGNEKIISLLQVAYGNRCNHGLETAVNKQNTHCIQRLFDHGAIPDFKLQHVVTCTLLDKAYPRCRQTLPTTEILQLFCDNGVQNQQILAAALEQARATKERAEEVIAILEKAGNINTALK